MMYKTIGAVFIILACGSFGFLLAATHRKEVRILKALIAAINYMKCELQFRCTPLPLLCKRAAAATAGPISSYFEELSNELTSQICPDVRSCAARALSKHKQLPNSVQETIITLGDTLGTFNLAGQIEGLESATKQAEQALEKLSNNQDQRLRNYQTLGLCAGAALAILLV